MQVNLGSSVFRLHKAEIKLLYEDTFEIVIVHLKVLFKNYMNFSFHSTEQVTEIIVS